MTIKIYKILLIGIVIAVVFFSLNIQVTTRQGINYIQYELKIPLYLKLLNFFDRNFNYQWTVKRIIGNSNEEEENVLKIFRWTCKNINKTPDGYPVIDDHVWHILVRGYGEADQFCDVFTTLCNFAGSDAFFAWISAKDNSSRMPLSFVNIKGRWTVFDPYRCIYFRNKKGDLADVENILQGNWVEMSIENRKEPDSTAYGYSNYFINLSPVIGTGLKKASIQSPVNRLKYEIKKWLK